MTAVARPYTLAAFEVASDKKDLDAWKEMLFAASAIVQNPSMKDLLVSHSLSWKQLADLFSELLAPMLNEERKNFLSLLAENKRLRVLPDIADLFAYYVSEQQKTLKVEVFSATDLDEKYRQKISAALAKRMQRQVELDCKVDPSLLGGVVVRAGDVVIDGSVRGKLNRLGDFIEM